MKNMKKIKVILPLIILVLFSINLSAQKVRYSADAGTNYSFFTLSKFQSSDKSTVNSSGKFGFYFRNNFTFSISEYLAIKTGLGFNSINADYQKVRKISGNQLIIIPNNGDTQPVYNGNTRPVLYEDIGGIVDGNHYMDITNSTNPNGLIGNPYYQVYQLSTPVQIRLAMLEQKLFLFTGASMSTIIQAKRSYKLESGKKSYKVDDEFNRVYFNTNLGVEYNLLKNLYAGIFYEYSLTNILNERFMYDSSRIHLHSFSLNLSYKF